MEIDSQKFDVESLLKNNKFQIPRFQRLYSWESEQVSQFWKDLIDNISTNYFIGSMVTYSTEKFSYALVDGQQRLTTITILLCAIRDHLKKLGIHNLATALHGYISSTDKNDQSFYVLSTGSSYPFLQDSIFIWTNQRLPLNHLQRKKL